MERKGRSLVKKPGFPAETIMTSKKSRQSSLSVYTWTASDLQPHQQQLDYTMNDLPQEELEPAADILEAAVTAEEELLAHVAEPLEGLAEVRGREHVPAWLLQHGAVHLPAHVRGVDGLEDVVDDGARVVGDAVGVEELQDVCVFLWWLIGVER